MCARICSAVRYKRVNQTVYSGALLCFYIYKSKEGREKTALYVDTCMAQERIYIYIIILDVIHKIDTPLLRKWKENFVLPVYTITLFYFKLEGFDVFKSTTFFVEKIINYLKGKALALIHKKKIPPWKLGFCYKWHKFVPLFFQLHPSITDEI